jgi:hypothetical protein
LKRLILGRESSLRLGLVDGNKWKPAGRHWMSDGN